MPRCHSHQLALHRHLEPHHKHQIREHHISQHQTSKHQHAALDTLHQVLLSLYDLELFGEATAATTAPTGFFHFANRLRSWPRCGADVLIVIPTGSWSVPAAVA